MTIVSVGPQGVRGSVGLKEVYDVGRGKIMKSLNVINKILKWTLSV